MISHPGSHQCQRQHLAIKCKQLSSTIMMVEVITLLNASKNHTPPKKNQVSNPMGAWRKIRSKGKRKLQGIVPRRNVIHQIHIWPISHLAKPFPFFSCKEPLFLRVHVMVSGFQFPPGSAKNHESFFELIDRDSESLPNCTMVLSICSLTSRVNESTSAAVRPLVETGSRTICC